MPSAVDAGAGVPIRCTLLGVGAMASPRFQPAGLLVADRRRRIMFDGGPGAAPPGHLGAWLVCDAESELRPAIKRLAESVGVQALVASFIDADLSIEPLEVVHTGHPTYGYLMRAGDARIVWAPEFLAFPEWAAGADLMFAEAAAWDQPIRFARGAGGHAPVLDVGEWASQAGVRRLVYAHIGRPTIRAMDRGLRPAYGEFGVEGRTYVVGLPT